MAPVSPAGAQLRSNPRPAQGLKWGRLLALLVCLALLSWGAIAAVRFVRVSEALSRLKSGDPAVRQKAATDLGHFKSRRAVEPLMAALGNPDSSIRTMAAAALGQIGDPRALEPLADALRSNGAKEGSTVEARAEAEALGSLGTPALDTLLDLLKDERLGGYAADGLEQMGAPAVGAVSGRLQSQNGDEAVQAATVLGEIKDRNAVPALIAALSAPTKDVHFTAAYELGEIKDARAIEPLTGMMKGDPEAENRREAAISLGVIQDPRADAALIAAIKDPDDTVKSAAAEALGSIADPTAANFLLDAYRQHDWAVIAGADDFFIRRGEAGTEDTLIEALNRSGSESMAVDFLNCGNQKLKDAAGDWASRNNYEITYLPGSKSAGWGGKQ